MKKTTLKIKLFALTLLCAFSFTMLNESVITEALTIDQTASPSEAEKEEQGSITGNVQGAEKTFSLVAPRAVSVMNWSDIGQKVFNKTVEDGINFGSFWPSGTGTESSPYELSKPEHLAWFSYAVNADASYRGAWAKVTADIDMTGSEYAAYQGARLHWTPIAWYNAEDWNSAAGLAQAYSGTFDGGGHMISNLYVDFATFQAGLFGCVNGGTIKNVTMADSTIFAEKYYAGAIAGVITGGTVISDCYSKVVIPNAAAWHGVVGAEVATSTGGIVGMAGGGANRIERCGYHGQVWASDEAGGILGNAVDGTVTIVDCFVLAEKLYQELSIGNKIGGIVANGGSGVTLINCYASFTAGDANDPETASDSLVAGIMHGTGATVTNCYYDSDKSGKGGDYGTPMTSADMTSGKLTGLLNSKSNADGTTEVDALRADRVWYSDYYWGTADKQKGNEGYPDHTKARYKDWSNVAVEMVNPPGTNGSDGKPMKGAPPVENGGAYEIHTAEQLAWFSKQVSADAAMAAKKLLIKANMNINGSAYVNGSTTEFLDWIPIGTVASQYSGNANGGNFTISGLHIDTASSPPDGSSTFGLFGMIENSASTEVSNFILSDGLMQINHRLADGGGALAGYIGEGVTVKNCVNKSVAVNGQGNIGGLIGRAALNVKISQCGNRGAVAHITGDFIKDSYIGGLIGYADTLNISNCYNIGNITGTGSSRTAVGGVSGISGGCTYANVYNAGTVTGAPSSTIMGGTTEYSSIIGESLSNTVQNCYYLSAAYNTSKANYTGLTDAQLKSWGATWLLNKKTASGVWAVGNPDNKSYPMIGSATRPNWQQLGEAADMGFLDAFQPFATDGNTEATAYEVSSPEQLAWYMYKANTDNANYKSKCLKLVNNINIYGNGHGRTYGTDVQWIPIRTFSGTLDGNGFQIQNIRMSAGGSNKALIWDLVNGTVKNLSTTGYIYAQYTAGIALNSNNSTITNCINSVSRRTPSPSFNREYGGGITYRAFNGTTITRCVNKGGVEKNKHFYEDSKGRAGGIAAILEAGCVIRDCYNRVNQNTVSTTVGGIVADNRGTIENCYNTAGGETKYYVSLHAIAAFNTGTITNCYYTTSNTDNTSSTKVTGQELSSLGMAYRLNAGRTGTDAAWTTDSASPQTNNGYAVLLPESEPFTPVYRDWRDVGSAVDAGGFPSITAPTQTGADEANAIELANPEQLSWFMYKITYDETYRNKYVKLTADMDMSGFQYNNQTAVGDGYVNCLPWLSGTLFKGTFDGQNHTVTNLYLNATGNNQGFFSQLNGAVVKNLTLKSGHIKNTGGYTGGFVGIPPGNVEITNCHTKDLLVEGTSYVGGIIGEVSTGNTTIRGCSVESEVKGTGETGGIVGAAYSSGTLSIEGCYHNGTVSGNPSSGIFARITTGLSGKVVRITGCYNIGSSQYQLSGTNCTVTDCYYDKEKGTTAGDHANTRGLTTLQLQSWYAAYLLNGRKFVGDASGTAATTWTSANNTSYASFGNLAEAANWEDVGRGVDAPAAGDGSSGSPYQLDSPEDLAWFMGWLNADITNRRTSCAVLAADIDLTGAAYHTGAKPLPWRQIAIGTAAAGGGRDPNVSYQGTFDGGNHTVSHMYINAESSKYRHSYCGLFGMAKNAVIKNLRMEQYEIIANSVSKEGGEIFIGGLVGETEGNVKISRVLIGEGSITANGMTWTLAGGIVGNNEGGAITISDSASRASMTVTRKSGANTGTGYGAAGFLCNRGKGYSTALISNSYYAGTTAGIVTGEKRSGHGAAIGESITVRNFYYDSDLLTPAGQSSGALFGTGVPTSQMQDGYITGRMNSIDSSTGAAADSLRDGRIWYSDHLYSSTNASKGNKGYPDFIPSKYTGWEDVGAEVATAAGSGTYGDIPAVGSYTDTSDGTTVTGYNITKPEQLAWLAYQVNHGIADPSGNNYSAFIGAGSTLSLEGSRYMDDSVINFPWTAIGIQNNPYKGTFHGKNCEIGKLYINKPDQPYQGLFGYATGASIRNVGIGADSSLTANGRVAGVVGGSDATSLFHCWNKADITSSSSQAGGIVGYLSAAAGDCQVIQCWNSGNITLNGTGYVGGVVGLSNYGSYSKLILNCFNTGNVSLTGGTNTSDGAAGILGWSNGAIVALSYNAGTISGTQSKGTFGIYAGEGIINYCFSLADSAPNTGMGNGGSQYSEENMKNGNMIGSLNSYEWKNNSLNDADSLRDDRLWYQDRSTDGSENKGYPCFTKSDYRNWYEVGRETANMAGSRDSEGNPMKGAKPGSEDDIGTYQITTPQQLAWFSVVRKGGGPVVLMNDLSLAGTEWTSDGSKLEWCPIPTYTNTFDGQNHTISDLYSSGSTANWVGLFEEVLGGTVSNLVLGSGSVSGGKFGAGALAGTVNEATITNCINRGVTVNGETAGGLFGSAWKSKMRRCGNLARVTGTTTGGGIAGIIAMDTNILYDSYNLGTIEADASGGIAGEADSGVTLRNVYNGGSSGSSTSSYPIAGGSPTIVNAYYKEAEFPSQTLTEQTGLREQEMKDGRLTGLLNSVDAESGNKVNSLRSDRIWFNDSGTAPVNLGYPLFLSNGGSYENWDQVGAQIVAEYGAADGSGNPIPTTKPKGKGTETEPYEIETPEQLAWIMHQVNADNAAYKSSRIVLKNNIDLTGADYRSDTAHALPWVPMGGRNAYFQGVFDGGGFVIDNLYINQPDKENQALIGYVDGATVKKVGIGPNSSVTGGDYSASLVGRCPIRGSAIYIYDCYNRGTVTGGMYSGGIFGDDDGDPANRGSVVANCYNTGLVTAESGASYVGVIAGNLSSGAITNCYYLDTSKGSSTAGGIGNSGTGIISVHALTDSYMKSGYLVGKLNSLDGATNTAVDSLRKEGRVWGRDRNNANGGYPLYTPTVYQNWAEVGQEVGNEAGASSGGTAFKGAVPSGDGTAASPYQISTPEQLGWLTGMMRLDVSAYRGKHAAMTANADLTGADYCPAGQTKLQWVPIGWGHAKPESRYSGDFDGMGHVISNLYINKSASEWLEMGLFGTTQGTISNIYLSDISITAGTNNGHVVMGAISGQMEGGKIERCGVLSGSLNCTNTIGGQHMVGGIVGDIHGGTDYIIDCFNMASVTSSKVNPGGIAGRNNAATYMRNCYFAGSGASGGKMYSQLLSGGITVQNCYYKAASYTAPGSSATNQQTGLTESQMKSGMLTGLLNKMDGMTGAETDSLRTGRVWYQDRSAPAFNSGYPMFVQSGFKNWQEVGIEAANGAGAVSGGVPMAGARPSGDGSSSSPYQIGTPEQLAWFMSKTNSDNGTYGKAWVNLTSDIDLFGEKYSGYEGGGNAVENALPWVPIAYQKEGGQPSIFYTGTFAGNGHTISHLYVPNDPNVYHYRVGMFSSMKGASLSGLKLDQTCKLYGSNRMGGFVSDICNGTVISDCENWAEVNAVEGGSRIPADTAGIAGWVAAYDDKTKVNKIIRCANYGAISCRREASGILGNVAAKAEVIDCYNRGAISAYGSVSYNEATGIVGVKEANGAPVIKNCYNAGKITAPAGRKTYAISKNPSTNCYYDKDVSGAVSDASLGGTPPMALDTSRMKAWGLPFLLNEKKLAGAWAMDEGAVKTNDSYPKLDTGTDLRSAEDWQEVGQFVGYGIGTAPSQSGDAYQIGTAEQLSWLMWQVNKESGMRGTKGTLTSDLDMTGADYQITSVTDPLRWIPIGAVTPGASGTPDGYQGTFNGDFHKVAKLRIEGKDRESGITGFFGYLNNATVKNLLLDVSMSCDGSPVLTAGFLQHRNGGVAGGAENSSLIRCAATGSLTVQSADSVSVMSSGIVASAKDTTVQSCYSRLSYTDNAGSSGHRFGGLMGHAVNASAIKNSYFAGLINGPAGVSQSLLAIGSGSETITDSAYDSQLTGAADSTGKGVGKTTSQMKNSRVLGLLNNGLSMDSLYYDKAMSNNGYPVFTASVNSGAVYAQGANGRQEDKASLTLEKLTLAEDSVYTALVNLRWYKQGQNGESSWSGGVPSGVTSIFLSSDAMLFRKGTRIAISWEKADGTRGFTKANTVSSDMKGTNLIGSIFQKTDGTFLGTGDLSEVQNQDLIFWIDMSGCAPASTIAGNLTCKINFSEIGLGSDDLRVELKPGSTYDLALNSSPAGSPAVTTGADGSMTFPVSWGITPSAGYAEKGEKPYVTVYLTDNAGNRVPFGDKAQISTDGGTSYTTPDNPYYHVVSDGSAASGSLTVKLKGQGNGEYQVNAAMYSSRLEAYDSDPASKGSKRGGYPVKTVSSGTSKVDAAVYEIKAEARIVSYDYDDAAMTPVELNISVLKPSGSTAAVKASLYRKNQLTGAYEEAAGYLTGGNDQTVTVTGDQAELQLAQSTPRGTYRLMMALYEGSEKKAEMPVNIIVK